MAAKRELLFTFYALSKSTFVTFLKKDNILNVNGTISKMLQRICVLSSYLVSLGSGWYLSSQRQILGNYQYVRDFWRAKFGPILVLTGVEEKEVNTNMSL